MSITLNELIHRVIADPDSYRDAFPTTPAPIEASMREWANTPLPPMATVQTHWTIAQNTLTGESVMARIARGARDFPELSSPVEEAGGRVTAEDFDRVRNMLHSAPERQDGRPVLTADEAARITAYMDSDREYRAPALTVQPTDPSNPEHVAAAEAAGPILDYYERTQAERNYLDHMRRLEEIRSGPVNRTLTGPDMIRHFERMRESTVMPDEIPRNTATGASIEAMQRQSIRELDHLRGRGLSEAAEIQRRSDELERQMQEFVAGNSNFDHTTVPDPSHPGVPDAPLPVSSNHFRRPDTGACHCGYTSMFSGDMDQHVNPPLPPANEGEYFRQSLSTSAERHARANSYNRPPRGHQYFSVDSRQIGRSARQGRLQNGEPFTLEPVSREQGDNDVYMVDSRGGIVGAITNIGLEGNEIVSGDPITYVDSRAPMTPRGLNHTDRDSNGEQSVPVEVHEDGSITVPSFGVPSSDPSVLEQFMSIRGEVGITRMPCGCLQANCDRCAPWIRPYDDRGTNDPE